MKLSDDEQALLDLLPGSGKTISNPVIQRRLRWDDDRYWSARNGLVDKALITRGRGRGGTLKRTPPEDAAPSTGREPRADAIENDCGESTGRPERELDLYEPMTSVLGREWSRDRRANPIVVETTALQGRRATGGTWSRPDIVSVEIRTYQYVPGKYLEVITFEVKASDSINVQAVYEALAHRRSATRSYVLLHVPKHSAEQLSESVEDVRAVCRSHGIGLIAAGDPGNYDTWEELEDAVRVEPDPERLDSFISTQLTTTTRDRVARGLR